MYTGSVASSSLRRASGWPLLVAAPVFLLACGGGGAASDASSLSGVDGLANGIFVDCSKESRATPYAPGTVVKSSGGHFDVTLVDNRPGASDANNAPGSWIRGSNTWDLAVKDSSTAQPLAGLEIQAVPRMPDHNHGTSITPVTKDEGQGQYVVSPLYLYMGGYWQVTLNIHASADGGPSLGVAGDSAVFNVCIPE